MSDNGGTGEKSEKATPKRLRDAHSVGQLTDLLTQALQVSTAPFNETLQRAGTQATTVFLSICATLLIPVALFGLLVEFLQKVLSACLVRTT